MKRTRDKNALFRTEASMWRLNGKERKMMLDHGKVETEQIRSAAGV